MSTEYTYPSTLELDLLTVLTTTPRRWVRLPFRAKPRFHRRPVEDVFESDTSRLFLTRRAPDAIDVTLDLDGGQLTRDVMEQIEEIRLMNAPVYIYPRYPGTAEYIWPLRRGVLGDPSDLTYTGTLGTGTTLYMLRASVSRGVSLIEVDPTDPVVLSGIYTSEHYESAFPLGQGIGVFTPRTNQIKNSLFGAVTGNVPANWTATAGTPGIDMDVITDSWIGTPALRLWGQSVIWTSDAITVTNGDRLGLSFAWKCDGVMAVTVNYDAVADVVVTLGPGSGWHSQQLVIPGASPTKVSLVVQGNAGMTYAEFSAPQLIGGATASDATPYFIGGSGSGAQGAISACSLRATGLHIEPHLQTSVPGVIDSLGLIAISGIVQPAWESNCGPYYGIAALLNSFTGKSISCDFNKAAGELGMFVEIWQDGALAARQSFAHARGNAYAFCLYCGQKSGVVTKILGCKLAAVGIPGTIYTAEATDIERYTCFDQVHIGETEADNMGLDGICGGYCVHSIRYAALDGYITKLATQDYLDLWRNLYAKQFRILPNLSPSPWARSSWGGTGTNPSIELQQYREL